MSGLSNKYWENEVELSFQELLEKINNMFDVKMNKNIIDTFKNIKIINVPLIDKEIKNIMKDEDFIFID
jgi:hypothetical protein